jgi:hypothetical protein
MIVLKSGSSTSWNPQGLSWPVLGFLCYSVRYCPRFHVAVAGLELITHTYGGITLLFNASHKISNLTLEVFIIIVHNYSPHQYEISNQNLLVSTDRSTPVYYNNVTNLIHFHFHKHFIVLILYTFRASSVHLQEALH